MKNRVCFAAPVLAALLVQVAFTAHAFTLGDLRGTAVIGRPLDVKVQVRASAGEEVSSACVTAEVFYADARQSAVKASVISAAGATAGSVVQVQSSAFIDEPVVTVEVRATCGSNTLRRYVLLADFPPLAAPLSQPASGAVELPSTSVLVLPAPAPSGPGFAAARVAVPARTVAGKSVAASTQPRPTSIKSRKTTGKADASEQGVMPKAARPTGKSILKLDPLDILSDRIDSLDSVMLFAPTEDALRYSRQIATLEGDVKTLRALAVGNDAKLSDLTVKLQQAQASQLPAWLIYGLMALLLVCLAAVVWLLQLQLRRGQGGAASTWWQNSVPATEVLDPALLAKSQPRVVMPAGPVAVKQKPLATQALAPDVNEVSTPEKAELDIDLDLDEDMADDAAFHGTFEVSTAGAPFEINSIRHISVEPILDIRQQAEFFVSLGQTDRALHILKKQIGESTEPNPLVYLDLITLYHSLGLKADFRECRETFHQLFNGAIPDFPAFNFEGHDLEAYPEVLTELVKLWPRMDALAMLSACIFHDVTAQHRGMFDLAAFRDLLMLHALAEDVVTDQPAANAFVAPEVPEMPPVVAAVPALPKTEKVDEFPSRMLDLDFSDLGNVPMSLKKTAPESGSDAGENTRFAARESWLADIKPK